ncbi:HAD family hydrolase [Zavarzinella formosa]|uniref:HAD family hydrolase n=1 Tax=Zavarzinella formosa TaxID=360055 RepID=UPI0002FBAD34|nr:HAD family hydrolase [Zavarzinella formosa]
MADTHELIRNDFPRGDFRAVLFDFDGTLSLFREGWPRLMTDMMVDFLREAGCVEPNDSLSLRVENFIMELNGRPAIFQMMRLAEEITALGKTPLPAESYLREYDRRLLAMTADRTAEVERQPEKAAVWAVPGTHDFLEELKRRGLKLYLASGTERHFMQPEADLLRVSGFFEEIHAPTAGDRSFSKRAVIDRILTTHSLQGHQLISFGDGVIETGETRKAGGVAVAVASDEGGNGTINQWKRIRLAEAGADWVIPDYTGQKTWLPELLGS